jgi:hypothetical protein
MISLAGASPGSVIDFEDLSEGDLASTLTTGGGGISGDPVAGFVEVNGFDPALAGNRAMVFDSECPLGGIPADCSGGDDDLGTPNEAFGGPGHSEDGSGASNDAELGKILILSEDLDSDDPDDADNFGSRFEFDFSNFGPGAVTVVSLNVLDIEQAEGEGGAKVRVYSDLGVTLIAEVSIDPTVDNGAATVIIGEDGVVFMEVILNGSGAIDNINIETEEELPAFARITGGGWRVTDPDGIDVRSSHGFTLHCDILLSNNLQINWQDGGSNKWHINKFVDAAFCEDDPDFTPEPPVAPADTYVGVDVGKLNNVDGSVACWILEDHGEVAGDPDGPDQALIRVWDVGAGPAIGAFDLTSDDPCMVASDPPDGDTVLFVPLSDVKGNLQFHFDQPHK